MKEEKKIGKLKLVLIVIFCLAVLFVFVGACLQKTYFTAKKDSIEPYGQMVDVNDGKMHVYKMGDGEKTIVITPGAGMALPSAEFGPLMRCLSEDYTVVCLEYFGSGFSTLTSKERICENYVEETRKALQGAGLEGPYVFMPHALSSAYSEYYASCYPEEVEAIISLDGTSTAYVGEGNEKMVEGMLSETKLFQTLGMNSIFASFTIDEDLLRTYGYTEQEIHDLKVYSGFSLNESQIGRMVDTIDSIEAANKKEYPKDIPYYKIISSQSYETGNEQSKMAPEEFQQKHLERVGAEENYTVLEGTNFIYYNNETKIKEITDEFLAGLK